MKKTLSEDSILVVEDDLDTSKMLAFLLKSIGFKKILVAKDGIEALSTIKSTKSIICIVSDWNMPRMSGIEFFLNFKKDYEKTKKIPFLMITTEAQKDKVEEAINVGITDYIIKPFNGLVVEDKLKKLLGNKYPNQ